MVVRGMVLLAETGVRVLTVMLAHCAGSRERGSAAGGRPLAWCCCASTEPAGLMQAASRARTVGSGSEGLGAARLPMDVVFVRRCRRR